MTADAGYHRFLKRYYAASFCYDFVFAYAIYTVFFSLQGMTVLEISLLLTLWSLAAMAFEVPSGALADSWSRRKMLAVAPVLKSLCFLTWYLADGSFYLFGLGFLLWAMGSSFVSGTTEALLYDTLVRHGRRGEYEEALGRRRFYFHIALAISGISGGFIAAYRMELAILLSVIPLLLSAGFALLLEESPRARSTGEIRYLEHIRLALREVRGNRRLRYLLMYLWGVSVFGVIEEFDQLYYHLAGLPIFAFGIALFVGSVLSALGARAAHRMKDSGFVMYALPLASAVLLAAVARYPSIPAIGLLLSAYCVTAPVQVLAESRIQHSITGRSRATVTSLVSLLLSIPILTPLFGLVSKVWNLQAIYMSAAILLFVLSVWAFGVRKGMEVEGGVG